MDTAVSRAGVEEASSTAMFTPKSFARRVRMRCMHAVSDEETRRTLVLDGSKVEKRAGEEDREGLVGEEGRERATVLITLRTAWSFGEASMIGFGGRDYVRRK